MKALTVAIVLFLLLMVFALNGRADGPYLGLSEGMSYAKRPAEFTSCDICSHYQFTNDKPVVVGFAGWRFKAPYAIEVGAGNLAMDEGYATVPTRPAEVHGTMKTDYAYLKGLRYWQLSERWEPYVGLGIIRYKTSQFERGQNCDGADAGNTETTCGPLGSGYQEHRAYAQGRRPIYTVGVEYRFSDWLSARGQWDHVTGLAASLGHAWVIPTERVDVFSLALKVSFWGTK